MAQNKIASLALKLLGIYTIIETIPLLKDLAEVFAWRGSKIEMVSREINTNLIFIGILATGGVLILTGLCLIRFSNALAKKMVDKNEINNSMTELSAKNIQSIAFSFVGLVMVVLAIPHLVQIAANLQALKMAGSETIKQNISIGTWAYSIGLAAQFIVGLLLFFGGKGLSTLWFKLKK
jgi:hypothetical protein